MIYSELIHVLLLLLAHLHSSSESQVGREGRKVYSAKDAFTQYHTGLQSSLAF